MPELVVADAGPLIGLARIGALGWLRQLFNSILIPEAVARELCLDSRMPGAVALTSAHDQGWLKVVPVADVPVRLLAERFPDQEPGQVPDGAQTPAAAPR